jgi:hypothetical protein
MPSKWGITPRQSIAAECGRRGQAAVVEGCARLIGGAYDDVDLVSALAGPAANYLLDGREHDDVYWFRVWGTRGLLWAWDGSDTAQDAMTTALGDEAWRVREMASKVVAKYLLADKLPMVAELSDDPVPRVRAAAVRAVMMLTQARA